MEIRHTIELTPETKAVLEAMNKQLAKLLAEQPRGDGGPPKRKSTAKPETPAVADEAIETAKDEKPAAKAVAEVLPDNKAPEVSVPAVQRLAKEIIAMGAKADALKIVKDASTTGKAAGIPEDKLPSVLLDLTTLKSRLENA